MDLGTTLSLIQCCLVPNHDSVGAQEGDVVVDDAYHSLGDPLDNLGGLVGDAINRSHNAVGDDVTCHTIDVAEDGAFHNLGVDVAIVDAYHSPDVLMDAALNGEEVGVASVAIDVLEDAVNLDDSLDDLDVPLGGLGVPLDDLGIPLDVLVGDLSVPLGELDVPKDLLCEQLVDGRIHTHRHLRTCHLQLRDHILGTHHTASAHSHMGRACGNYMDDEVERVTMDALLARPSLATQMVHLLRKQHHNHCNNRLLLHCSSPSRSRILTMRKL